MTNDAELGDLARKRTKQVFDYLAHLHVAMYPPIRNVTEHPWALRLNTVPKGPWVTLPALEHEERQKDHE